MRVKYIVSEAVQVVLSVKEWYEDFFVDYYDDIESKLIDRGLDFNSLIDRHSFGTEGDVGTEILVFKTGDVVTFYEEEVDGNTYRINSGDFIEIDEEMAGMLNSKDTYGEKDFSDGDVFEVSKVYHKRPNSIEYKVDTYVVTVKDLNINFESEDEREGDDGLHTSSERETAKVVNREGISDT